MKKISYSKTQIFCIVASFLVLFSVNYCWFLPLLEKGTLMGDDIRFINIVKSSDSILKTMLTNGGGVYRPVSYLLMAILVKVFGTFYAGYFFANLLLNSIIILSVYIVIANLNKNKSVFIPFVGALLYIISIYSYYGITQLLGFMELLCVLFTVWYAFFLIKYIERKECKYYILSVVFYASAMLSHERFLALFGVYFVLNIFILYDEKFTKRLINLAISAVPMFFFLLMKLVVFKVPLFVGTGQVPIKFSFIQTFKFIMQSIMSMFGVNIGDRYLFGHVFSEYNTTEKIMHFGLMALFVLLFVMYFVKNISLRKNEERIGEVKKLVLFIFIEGAVIVCYAVSSRIEMREVYVPYTLLIVYAMYCVGKIDFYPHYEKLLVMVMLGITCTNSYIFRQNVDVLFFMRTMKMAETGYNVTIGANEPLSEYEIYIEENNELDWAMLLSDEKDIFYMYLDRPIRYKRYSDLETMNMEITECLEKGQKVKVLYIKNDGEIKSLNFETLGQEVDLQKQIIRE